MGGECCLMQCDLTASSSTTRNRAKRARLQSKAIYSRPWITWGSSGFACNQLQMNRCHITLSHFCAHFDWPAHTHTHTRPAYLHCFTVILLTWSRKKSTKSFYFWCQSVQVCKWDLRATENNYFNFINFCTLNYCIISEDFWILSISHVNHFYGAFL